MVQTLGLEKTKFCSSLEREEWSGTSRKLFLFPKVFNNKKNYVHHYCYYCWAFHLKTMTLDIGLHATTVKGFHNRSKSIISHEFNIRSAYLLLKLDR
jgi:hypothetical protein